MLLLQSPINLINVAAPTEPGVPRSPRRTMKKSLKKCLKSRSRLVAARRRIAHLDLGEQVPESAPCPPNNQPDSPRTKPSRNKD